jgi:hypothetical protein
MVYLTMLTVALAGHSGRMKCLRPLEHWDRGFESR